ncbi:rubredoxin [Methylococcus sp. EFPC2]|uniref:rubredoxin n=1 Tax=Methylococcus sp. EFPC2 TaxID=2812648 RepID=UPI001967B110|nr:rubredoxin [Methylococcus sp. EFPC2]QSA97691.1 rubredoxin [Methylococcus sp. EFPC2]
MPEFKKYVCAVCGYIYDEELGDPENGIQPGTRWKDVPEDWSCPDCAATKADFDLVTI